MNISDLTPEQRQEVLRHLRLAAIARTKQWHHESQIEVILEREINVAIQDLACNIGTYDEDITPDELGWLSEEDLTDWIPDV